MSSYWTLIIIGLLYFNQESEPGIAMRKIVYQKDMSEYCRRRVVPSIFLGRHVVEANSEILHFSRMELPYSCFISVRTESGSNIIFFIQLVSEESLITACSESSNQLLVYEMGETFGGYWGPLPETLVQRKHEESIKYYTLKTTQPTTTTEVSPQEESENSVSEVTEIVTELQTKSEQPRDTDDSVLIEIPIVNVSGQLVPGGVQRMGFEFDETFDRIYDVTPRRGEQYKTSILPLVQFSISEQESPGRSDDAVPRYQLDYSFDTFTPDARLKYPIIQLTSTKKKNYKYRYNTNRRFKYRKNNRHYGARKPSIYLKKQYKTTPLATQPTTSWHDIYFIANNAVKSDVQQIPMTINDKNIENNDSWAYINNLMETLKRNTLPDNFEKTVASLNFSALIPDVTDMHRNLSIYLVPEHSLYNFAKVKPKSLEAFSFSPVGSSSTISISSNFAQEYNTSTENITTDKQAENEISELIKAENMMPQMSQILKNVALTNKANSKSFTSKINDNQELRGSEEYTILKNSTTSQPMQLNMISESNLDNPDIFEDITNIQIINENGYNTTISTSTVDHESWENVVQAASDMAVILNHTYDDNSKNMTAYRIKQNVTKQKRNTVRKKRFIQSVPIEDARPHSLTTRNNIPTTTRSTYKVADLQDFVQLAELQDDEMHGRVALRYLRHYAGPVMFNICDYHEINDRQVFLFNSSRIVIAITNFTMDRITIVVTPARTLLSAEAHCSSAHLECQVSGTRVCIDSMCACDGVPNCGTYDIYDEDRLMCGAAEGIQHNVCLAAFTFLAVLLTMLYTVHYWLKRCVPKVSDAFFIYSNGAENILYLDTIMRSPNDLGESKLLYRGNIFDDDITNSDANKDMIRSSNKIMNFMRKLPGFKMLKHTFKKQGKEKIMNSEVYVGNHELRKMYSFTEFEIQKMIGMKSNDAAVQTGDSLEMEHLIRMKKKEEDTISSERTIDQYAKIIRKPQVLRENTALSTLENTSQRLSQIDELNILHFFREARTESIISTSIEARRQMMKNSKFDTIEEEKELNSHMYETQGLYAPGPSGRLKPDMPSQTLPPEFTGPVKKHLRFEEEATTIPSEEYEEDQMEGKESPGRRSLSSVSGKKWVSDMNTALEDIDEGTSAGREHRSFWGGNKKGKKLKKITQVPLR